MNSWMHRIFVTVPVVIGLFGFAQPSMAAKTLGTFDEVIRDAAEEILKITKDEPIVIGQFTETFLPGTNSGPAIGELLKKALEVLKPGILRPDAEFQVKGDYELTENPDRKSLKAVRISFQIISKSSREKKTLELIRHVDDNSSIGRILNLTGHIDDKGDRETRNKELERLSKKAEFFIDPAHRSRVSSKQGSPFSVEILAGADSQSCQAREAKPTADGPEVDIKRGELYEIKIHNNSREEVAVAIFIDSLSVFHFSEDKLSHWIVPPGESTIVGWHRSLKDQTLDRFLVTEYGKGASSQVGIPVTGPIGVIQVQFSQCLDPLSGGRKRSASNETGFGPRVKVSHVKVEKEIVPPSDFVTLRYTR